MAQQMHSAGGSHERPPIFFAPLRQAWLALATGLMLTASALTHAATGAPAEPPPTASNSNAGYRLAGVMLVGQDRIGFLEVPTGGQVLVRQGSIIDGGTVTVFNGREMRIVFPNRTVVLELEAGAGQPTGPVTLGVVTHQDDNGHVMVRQVDADRMAAALEAARAVEGAPPRKPTQTRAQAQAEAGRRFAAVLNLPTSARVVAVNDQPVVTAEKAIANVEATLAAGNSATLTLAAAPGEPEGRVYLSPKRD